MSEKRNAETRTVEEQNITHSDEGVSFEVKIQSGSSSDRTAVKAKLKTPTLGEFMAQRDGFLSEVREGAQKAVEAHEEVFSDDEDE